MKMRLSKFIIIIVLLSAGFPLCLAQREGHDDFDKVLEENSFKEASEAISLVDDLEHMLYDPINDASVTNISPLKAPLPPAETGPFPGQYGTGPRIRPFPGSRPSPGRA